ncbi:dihydrofolate reductase family protein [Eubacteriales bacterium OttesenSCG-928-N13]|nr:dihydrofolate reductase family protein [Eubacteriales bacterium OttesenSCG-928-N13]
MSKLILYIACSLDGYIADAEGGISFLDDTPSPQPDLGYEAFYNSVDTLIMGGTTYRQVVNDLSPGNWPYMGKKRFIYTRQPLDKRGGIEATDLPPAQLLRQIRQTSKGDIWLVGGGEIVRLFMSDKLIDQYFIYFMPVLLGDGIPLFPEGFPRADLKLESMQKIGEIAELVYSKRP